MGTEATGLGMGLVDQAQMEEYSCIPVDHAVAVECDEQVLGELDVAGFEEFSRRIYALNENMSSFRRPHTVDRVNRGAEQPRSFNTSAAAGSPDTMNRTIPFPPEAVPIS
ncbi:hypothetical protein WMY93_007720 [Mugilogobius chulae]|uniref:Uncharacterized protein n=1 Tax=Mugilogobius chulae TaxID=88201 RepID=A0AAW0PMV8_9GOBI